MSAAITSGPRQFIWHSRGHAGSNNNTSPILCIRSWHVISSHSSRTRMKDQDHRVFLSEKPGAKDVPDHLGCRSQTLIVFSHIGYGLAVLHKRKDRSGPDVVMQIPNIETYHVFSIWVAGGRLLFHPRWPLQAACESFSPNGISL